MLRPTAENTTRSLRSPSSRRRISRSSRASSRHVSPDSNPSLAERRDVQKQLEKFSRKHLSKDTELYRYFIPDKRRGDHDPDVTGLRRKELHNENIEQVLQQWASNFVEILTDDSRKLAISDKDLKFLINHLGLPASFISAVCQNYQPCGTGFRMLTANEGIQSWDYWALIPFRVRDICQRVESEKIHTSSAGKNQMNPYNYIHLKDVGEDIRGSHVALHVRYDDEAKLTTAFAITFLDDRFKHLINMSLKRLEASMQANSHEFMIDDGLLIHMTYLNVIVDWWNDVFYSFNEQLVEEEKNLQQELENSELNSAGLARSRAAVNKRLHIMAAHLHRYGTELGRFEDIIIELESLYDKLMPDGGGGTEPRKDKYRSDTLNEISQLLSQTRAIKYFRNELEKKIQNILALLFNNMQVINDQTMQNILHATQLDNQRSQGLAKSMKEDSIAMKTIAILTMVFLPGTSYAALLAMPFFSSNGYLTTPTRIWVWVVLTVPSTALAFFIYRKVMVRAQRKYNLGDEEMQERNSSLGNGEQQALEYESVAVKDREISK